MTSASRSRPQRSLGRQLRVNYDGSGLQCLNLSPSPSTCPRPRTNTCITFSLRPEQQEPWLHVVRWLISLQPQARLEQQQHRGKVLVRRRDLVRVRVRVRFEVGVRVRVDPKAVMSSSGGETFLQPVRGAYYLVLST